MAIILIGENIPAEPVDFERKLQRFDKDLVITWHHPPAWRRSRPGCWKIEQCVRHASGLFHDDGRPKHTHVCDRIYVTMVQDEEGTPLPLGEHVFEKLKAMRANSEKFGGQTERGLRNFIQESNNIDQEFEAKRELARQEIMKHNQRFNRSTFNRLVNLVESSDMRPNR